MIRKVGDELVEAKLDELCQERALRRRQEIRDEINGRLGEIVRMSNPPPEEMTRPYGVPHEGKAYDVWYHVLKWATDPSEIQTYWKVSEKFRDILRGKYIETTFVEIVTLILEKRPYYLLPGNHMEYWRILTFLGLRGMSSHCKRSVEDISTSEKIGRDLTSLRIGSIEKVERITGALLENPAMAASFFPVNVIIDDKNSIPQYARGEFHEAITFFLQLAGHRIHIFKYVSSLVSVPEMHDLLREWMKLMPNLTHFTLRQHYRMDDVGYDEVPAHEDVGLFPHLPKLLCYEEISIELPTWFAEGILKASPRIRDLRLLESFEMREHSPQVLETLGDLTSLQIYPTRSLMDHHHLPWKLNKLRLCREDMDEHEEQSPKITIASCTLFNFLKQFEATLQHLEIEMVDVIKSCCRDSCLELRNLRTLKMELHESFEDLNFLLYAERLEMLHLKIEKEFKWNVNPREELRRMIWRSFLGRSVWEVFPYLKSLRLESGKQCYPKAMVEEYRTIQ